MIVMVTGAAVMDFHNYHSARQLDLFARVGDDDGDVYFVGCTVLVVVENSGKLHKFNWMK